ncbi:hypothetical protein AX16_003104 [Volvariella volvacea WC 439]|nr:hypothetical protein AX16_003104 [Volvariella volvacea WC 439]
MPEGINRPHSSLARPSTSLGNRASKDLPPRPASSASQHRPKSADGKPTRTRTLSNASNRPSSRLSVRSHIRHVKSRLIPQAQALVTHVIGLKEEGTEGDPTGEFFQQAVEFVVKNLEGTTLMKAAASEDMANIDKRIGGHALKARINSRDVLAKALEESYKRLKQPGQTQDLDDAIKVSRLPDHLQFLLELSQPPSEETLEHAQDYLDRLENPQQGDKLLTWADILADDPFEGEHWQGIHPPGSARKPEGENSEEDLRSDDSSSSLSTLESELEDSYTTSDDYDAEPRSRPSSILPPSESPDATSRSQAPYNYAHRQAFEELQKRQYWKESWRSDVDVTKPFSFGDASTLGPSLQRASLHKDLAFVVDSMREERYIHEENAVREVLMALQGRRNILLKWSDGSFKPIEPGPRLAHLSLASQHSILSSFAHTATIIQHLRNFANSVITPPPPTHTESSNQTYVRKQTHKVTQTLEAFADAIDYELRSFDTWCAGREEAICRAQQGLSDQSLVVSLLSTEKAIKDKFEASFDMLLDTVRRVLCTSSLSSSSHTGGNNHTINYGEEWKMGIRGKAPSVVATSLLDTLFSYIQEQLERRENVTADALMRVFVRSAEPIWAMMGQWINDGMGTGLDGRTGAGLGQDTGLEDEFFIESIGLGLGALSGGLLDPEFWSEGYSLRVASDDDDPDGYTSSRVGKSSKREIPLFLEHIAGPVLEAGKAIGLLKVLDSTPQLEAASGNWVTFRDLVAMGDEHSVEDRNLQDLSIERGLFSVSIDTLSRLIYDWLYPRCQTAGEQLAKVLVDECGLWQHLNALEDLYLMRRGDAVNHFFDVIFAKMDAKQPWHDFHFLNTAFTDVVEASFAGGTKPWIHPSLVRFSYRSSRHPRDNISINRTIKAVEGLLVEYAMPFPLTYIFQPKMLAIYGEIFVFLLQIHRTKSVLERVLVRGHTYRARPRNSEVRDELGGFYAVRGRFSWFINTLLSFLTTYVLHTQIASFHNTLGKCRSLDEMISAHDIHTQRLQERCFLGSSTSSLHRAILSIFDISLHFTEFFISFTESITGTKTTTHDVSYTSIISIKRHRSKRYRSQRRNVIGFSQPLRESLDSSDEEESDEDEVDPATEISHSSFSLASVESLQYEDEPFSTRLDRMSSDLDGLVRFIRRGVEGLANGTGEAASTFGILAFALEDWDN